MLVSICPILYGSHIFINADESSNFDYLSRRISRTATLDGGCHIADNGFTPSDGNITIVIPASNNNKILQANIQQLIQQFGLFTISTARHGFFICAFESVVFDKGELKLNFLIKTKVQ